MHLENDLKTKEVTRNKAKETQLIKCFEQIVKEALQWTTSLIEVNRLHYSTQVYQIDQTMGSILRPLLFLVFINSFPQHLEANQICELFANDTTILFSTNQGDNTEEQIT